MTECRSRPVYLAKVCVMTGAGPGWHSLLGISIKIKIQRYQVTLLFTQLTPVPTLSVIYDSIRASLTLSGNINYTATPFPISWNLIENVSFCNTFITFSVLITRHMTKVVIGQNVRIGQLYKTLKRTQFDDRIIILLIAVVLVEPSVWAARPQRCTYRWEYTVSQWSKPIGNDVYKISAIKVELNALTTSHSSPVWVI